MVWTGNQPGIGSVPRGRPPGGTTPHRSWSLFRRQRPKPIPLPMPSVLLNGCVGLLSRIGGLAWIGVHPPRKRVPHPLFLPRFPPLREALMLLPQCRTVPGCQPSSFHRSLPRPRGAKERPPSFNWARFPRFPTTDDRYRFWAWSPRSADCGMLPTQSRRARGQEEGLWNRAYFQ